MKKDLLDIRDLGRDDFRLIMRRTRELKELRRAGVPHLTLAQRTVGLLFEKPSTRTRASFEAGMYQLGGRVIYMPGRDTQLSRDEPIADTARVLSRYLDGLVVRTFGHEIIEELAAVATIPVINALTDSFHPCQVISDLYTVLEVKGRCEGLKYAWVGDGNNMANSWINAAAVLGLNLVLAC
ncbi:MAG: ornithine carbamoyltransferase, partial [Proteobacteria bacterium]|nr:ornithine carbamoyltransferase [Pseudomonadota bacterium]